MLNRVFNAKKDIWPNIQVDDGQVGPALVGPNLSETTGVTLSVGDIIMNVARIDGGTDGSLSRCSTFCLNFWDRRTGPHTL